MQPEYDLKSLRVRKLGPERRSFGDVIRLETDVAKVSSSPESENLKKNICPRTRSDWAAGVGKRERADLGGKRGLGLGERLQDGVQRVELEHGAAGGERFAALDPVELDVRPIASPELPPSDDDRGDT